jgi:hypothetical protein
MVSGGNGFKKEDIVLLRVCKLLYFNTGIEVVFNIYMAVNSNIMG